MSKRFLLALLTGCVASATALPAQKFEPDPKAKERKEYRARLAKLDARDGDGLAALAQWCRDQKLYGEMRRTAKKAVVLAPQNESAHILLGNMKVDGRWLPKRKAMPQLGYVKYKGKWHTLDEFARLRAIEGHQKRVRRLQRTIDKHVRHMSVSSDKIRMKARDDLIVFARKEGLPKLVPAAHKLHDELGAYWAEVRRANALIEVRAQQANLVRMRRFQTSLGAGSPVTLELPEVRSVSIGTTVLVPVR
ncbi:MAG: hypothetical protein CMJ83_02250 [Planctomycetes bacterium]|nr:hypothetical protein [Planctomycetota bacterium]